MNEQQQQQQQIQLKIKAIKITNFLHLIHLPPIKFTILNIKNRHRNNVHRGTTLHHRIEIYIRINLYLVCCHCWLDGDSVDCTVCVPSLCFRLEIGYIHFNHKLHNKILFANQQTKRKFIKVFLFVCILLREYI